MLTKTLAWIDENQSSEGEDALDIIYGSTLAEAHRGFAILKQEIQEISSTLRVELPQNINGLNQNAGRALAANAEYLAMALRYHNEFLDRFSKTSSPQVQCPICLGVEVQVACH